MSQAVAIGVQSEKTNESAGRLAHSAKACGIAALAILMGPHVALAQAASGGLDIAGNEPSYVDFGAGAFNIQNHNGAGRQAEGRIEFRYGRKLFYIGPALGLLATSKGGVYGYGGFYSDITYRGFVITPMMGLGGYHRGGSEDLGGTLQFRLSLNVAYELSNRTRLGVQFAHLSNADSEASNPGDNELLVTYAIPLSF